MDYAFLEAAHIADLFRDINELALEQNGIQASLSNMEKARVAHDLRLPQVKSALESKRKELCDYITAKHEEHRKEQAEKEKKALEEQAAKEQADRDQAAMLSLAARHEVESMDVISPEKPKELSKNSIEELVLAIENREESKAPAAPLVVLPKSNNKPSLKDLRAGKV